MTDSYEGKYVDCESLSSKEIQAKYEMTNHVALT